jgi:hypothetical protein
MFQCSHTIIRERIIQRVVNSVVMWLQLMYLNWVF